MKECSQTSWMRDEAYWDEFAKKIDRLRIPFSGSIDLSHRCNLNCLHCYVRDGTNSPGNSGRELGTDQWKRILDEITEAGCLYLLISGGEPLIRSDFADIYSYARRCGLLVTLFTNGTMVTEETVELLQRFPPNAVEITLYGATANTHDAVTGVRGSFDQSLKGIGMLVHGKIKVNLKSMLMTLNLHEISGIREIAEGYGVNFRIDASLFPTLKGDKFPLGFRVEPEKAIAEEFADQKMIDEWRDFLKRYQGVPFSDSLYQCGAGISTFHIDPYGLLRPCLMVTRLTYNLLEGSFKQGWFDVMPRIRGKKAGAADECRHCRQRLLCGYCPGFFELENGADDVRSKYLCTLGKLRFAKISRRSSGGKNVPDL